MKINSIRTQAYDDQANITALVGNLDLLEAKRERAQLRLATYQQRAARYYNSRVRERRFRVGELVLRKVLPNM